MSETPNNAKTLFPFWAQLLILFILFLLILIISSGLGYIKVPFIDVVKVLVANITGRPDMLGTMDSLFPVVVVDVRLPRILTSAMVGAGLAISGVIFQGILLNPLADPLHPGCFGRCSVRGFFGHPLEYNPHGVLVGSCMRLFGGTPDTCPCNISFGIRRRFFIQ